MGFTYRIDHSNRLIFTSVAGVVSCADTEAHFQDELRDQVLSYRELIDIRGANIDLSGSEARRVAVSIKRLAKTCSVGPIAIVTATNMNFGMARMISMLVDSACHIEVFRDVVEAEEWLRGQDGRIV